MGKHWWQFITFGEADYFVTPNGGVVENPSKRRVTQMTACKQTFSADPYGFGDERTMAKDDDLRDKISEMPDPYQGGAT